MKSGEVKVVSVNFGCHIPDGSSTESSDAAASDVTETTTSGRSSVATSRNDANETAFMKLMDCFFRKAGFFIADHAGFILTVVLLFTAVTSIKIPLTKQEDDLRSGYTPINARSYHEVALYEEFYAKQSSAPIALVVFIRAKDNGTLTRVEQLNETVNVMDHIGSQFTLGNTSQVFYQFCSDFCEFNEPLRQYRNGFIIQNTGGFTKAEEDGSLFDARFNLSFPFMSVMGNELDLSPLFFGVETFRNADEQREAKLTTNVKNLPLIVLQFRADIPPHVSKEEVEEWERSISNYYHNKYDNKYVKPLVMSVTYAGDEILRNGMTLFPYISLGFAILSTFSIITIWMSAYYYDQMSYYKIIIAVSGCICPILACSSALGTLFWFGFRYGSILAVTPFLVMAIGVDDAFLMVHAWQRIVVEKRAQKSQNVLYGASVRDHISAMAADVGPSVSITSVTNILAFIVGVYSPTPEIKLFCVGNAVAILFDYIYQFILFVPVMVIVARSEMKKDEKKRKTSPEKYTPSEFRLSLHKNLNSMLWHYCKWTANNCTIIITLFMLVVYWFVSIRGALSIKASITPNKLFLADSLVNTMNDLRDQYILPDYTAVNVFVNNVGEISNATRRERMQQLIQDFESLPFCLGAEYTHFWMRDFDKFLNTTIEDEEFNFDSPGTGTFNFTKSEMEQFLSWPEYRHWNGFMRFDSEGNMEKFFAVVAYSGKELIDWNFRGSLLNRFRATADQFADLEAWVFEDDAQFLDQIETLIPVTISSSFATLICMAIVCFVFMYNVFTVFVATSSILSVCIGVFGFLAMWGIDLDPISMATTIMSIGFSVDFPAHASFHYFRTGCEEGGKLTPEERVFRVLSAIGFPLFQCGFSTVFFVLCLLCVPSYMSEVFVKTMVLVIVFGLIHGLFVIPVALCAFSKLNALFCKLPKSKKSTLKSLSSSNSFKTIFTAKKVHTTGKNAEKIAVNGSA